MKYTTKVSVLFIALFRLTFAGASAQSLLPVDSVLKIAAQAYVYGLPIVFTDITRQASFAPNNVYRHSHKFPDHTARLVVAPNNDTNYSSAFLDLGEEPVVLYIPDTKERYYVLPLMDAWTNVFASFGKRTTGTKEQVVVVTGPHFKGKLPKGLKEVKSPTDLVWIIGRIQVNSPADQADFVSPLQEKFTITPLSQWGKPTTVTTTASTTYTTDLPQIKEVQARKITVVQAVKQIPIERYFNYLNELMVKNPGLKQDAPLLKKLAAIGLKPGAKFSLNSFDPQTQQALEAIPKRIFAAFDAGSLEELGTTKTKGIIGEYGTDYRMRAAVAYKGLGALSPKEAVYLGIVSPDKSALSGAGANTYVIHFNKGELPPARAFWSLTLYDKDRYLAANDIRRYAIGDRNPLKYNADGSVDIYVQHENPGPEKENNWLPAPAEYFSITLRIYWATDTYLNNRASWKEPYITKTN